MIFRVYLRSHDGPETGRILERIEPTGDTDAAVAAYRRFLARNDFSGQKVAAVLSRNRVSIYFSRFDRNFGDGRIHPNAPLDPWVDGPDATATNWHPVDTAALPIGEALVAWRQARGWTRATLADYLGVPPRTLEAWEQGRQTPDQEGPIRKIMTLT